MKKPKREGRMKLRQNNRMRVHDGNSVFGACAEFVVFGDKRVGDGGGRYRHLIQSGLVTGNSSCVG